jgi:tetratricopeptide (TPR) repeat protein
VLAEPRLVIGLSANGQSAPVLYPGAPVILSASLFSASGEPIVLESKAGSWSADLAIKMVAADGSSPELRFRQAGPPANKATLDVAGAAHVYWILSPEDAQALGPGPFEITLSADMRQVAAPGAWNGVASSNSVRISIRQEPAEWTFSMLNQHWLGLSLYHELLGDSGAALAAVEELLGKQPGSVSGWIRKGDILTANENLEEASACFRRALRILYEDDPKPTHPPSEILGKLNAIEQRRLP